MKLIGYSNFILLCSLVSLTCGANSEPNTNAIPTLERFLQSEAHAGDDARIRYAKLSPDQIAFDKKLRSAMKLGLFLIDEDPMVLIADYMIDTKSLRKKDSNLYISVKFLELGAAEGRGDVDISSRRYIREYDPYKCHTIEYKLAETADREYTIIEPPEPRVLLDTALSEYKRVVSEVQLGTGASDYDKYWSSELQKIIDIRSNADSGRIKIEEYCRKE